MIVLDTHALIWWLNAGPQLSSNARAAIEHEISENEGIVLVSAISAWEIAMLVDRGKLTLAMDVDEWLETANTIEELRFVPVDQHVGVESVRLPGSFHKDPADRLIVALARHMNVPLVTGDSKIQAYKHVRCIW